MKNKVLAMVLAVVMVVTVAPMATITAGANDTQEHVVFTVTDKAEQGEMKNYTFTLDRAGRVWLNFSVPEVVNDSKIAFVVSLSDSNNTRLLFFLVNANEISQRSIHNYLSAGTYTIHVETAWGDGFVTTYNNAEYTVSANFTENVGQFEVEGNDTPATATPLKVNNPITGNLFANAYRSDGHTSLRPFQHYDVDYFTFTLDRAGRVSINFQHANVNHNAQMWEITLFDSNNTVLLDFRSRGNEMNKDSINNYLDIGTYIVRVRFPSTGQVTHSNTDYTMTVNYEENTGQFETESNDINPNQINVNSPITGNLYHKEDIDYFGFSITELTQVSLNLKHLNCLSLRLRQR